MSSPGRAASRTPDWCSARTAPSHAGTSGRADVAAAGGCREGTARLAMPSALREKALHPVLPLVPAGAPRSGTGKHCRRCRRSPPGRSGTRDAVRARGQAEFARTMAFYVDRDVKLTKSKAVVVDMPESHSEVEEAEWRDRHQDLIADLLLEHRFTAAQDRLSRRWHQREILVAILAATPINFRRTFVDAISRPLS